MTVVSKTLVQTQYAANSITAVYAPSGARAIIDRFTATNNSTLACQFSLYLVPNGQSATAANRLLDRRSIEPGVSYSCPEITGHALESGDQIVTLAQTGASITIRCTGREVS
jgi:hypothetical protein